jgi:DNA polymerase-3 subunit gamma/tau
VFENIIDQSAAVQLRDDILSARQAPSMLFFGPSGCGKGSTALELARSLSCEHGASWKCGCPSCERHRYLQHGDLLILGPRPFQAEIAASSASFLRDTSSLPAKTLFIRSLRKLLSRFNFIVMEDDPKLGKISHILQSLEEGLNELDLAGNAEKNLIEKITASLVKDAVKLESEGMGDLIPASHIRRASYWCRLTPGGKRKTFIIENAQQMKDEARNSLLKLLEEPPETVSIVLTSQRREAIMPTILSRLRPYRFLKRAVESEKDVIRRVFRDSPDEKLYTQGGASLISAYLDSFLSVNMENLQPLAAYFLVSLARIALANARKNDSHEIPPIINSIAECYASAANTSELKNSLQSSVIIKIILTKSGNFENDSFSRFLKILLDLFMELARRNNNSGYIKYLDIFKKYCAEARTAVEVLNQNSALALEALFFKLHTALSGGRL